MVDRLGSEAREGLIESDLSPLLEAAGRRLQVNADAARGSLSVEVLSTHGDVLDGYAAADCIPLRADAVRHDVSWGERRRLPSDQPVRLRLLFTDTDLYSLRLRD